MTKHSDYANGVLLRALALPNEPERIAAGPALLAKRFGITRAHDSLQISRENGLWLAKQPSIKNNLNIVNTTRVGISQAKDLPWRWYMQYSRSVSKREKGDKTPELANAWIPSTNDGP